MSQILRFGIFKHQIKVPCSRLCLYTLPLVARTEQSSTPLVKLKNKCRWSLYRRFTIANYCSGRGSGASSHNNPNRLNRYPLITGLLSIFFYGVAYQLINSMPDIRRISFEELVSMLKKGEVRCIETTNTGYVLIHRYEIGKPPSLARANPCFSFTLLTVNSGEINFEIVDTTISLILLSLRNANFRPFSNKKRLESPLTDKLLNKTFPSRFKNTPSTNAPPPKPSGSSNDSENDRFPFRPPFHWDPFSGFNTIKPTTTTVKFKDVAGLHACKQEVMEFVSYLKNPQKYQALGAKLPKGALLLGPPGTGKTLLVKALANEAEVPFFSMAGPEFVEVIGGLGALRLRQLFKVARSYSPAIIFIDELDSLGRRRDSADSGRSGKGGGRGGGVSEMEQTLNQLLVEMDGMDTTEDVIVFGATNRADLLDKALLRAGRFDRHIFINLPNLAERKEIFAIYIAKYRLAPDVVQDELVERLSGWCPGMSGADIARLCNEAALSAARRDDKVIGVTKADFETAFERILAGAAKRSNPLTAAERHMSAVHESGRALVAWLLPRSGLLPVKISIIPRTVSGPDTVGDLGFTQLISEEKYLLNTDDLADRMAVLLGGRAAEQIVYNAVSDISQKYIREASKLAMKQVRQFGMSKTIGNLSFNDDSTSGQFSLKPYCQRTEAIMELEANQLVASAFSRCVKMLQENKNNLLLLIDALVKKEVLSYDDLIQLLGDDQRSPRIKPRL
ncbi:Paraplegin [Schistosoma japonicum]|uniref:Paraplegin n=2 Tax=Schistosoma japonicum TaxID=6182 RepID=A0A4Z2DL86_SCHJA|nr:Paraplegin [Schistosoma japonicum]